MFTPNPSYLSDGIRGRYPGTFFGDGAPAGATAPWVTAPVGTLYIRTNAGNVKLYIKTANASADADWQYANVT